MLVTNVLFLSLLGFVFIKALEDRCYSIKWDLAAAAGPRSQLVVPVTRFPAGLMPMHAR
jgi:hypothetical protein